MTSKKDIEGPLMAFASYKAKSGQEEALKEVIAKHLPLLRELGLASSRNSYMAQSMDGTIIEIFEWTSMNAVNAAHQHPAVSSVWEKITLIADFVSLKDLPEAENPFPGFRILN